MADRKPNDDIRNPAAWVEGVALVFLIFVIMMAPVWDAEARQGGGARVVETPGK